ncbi:MAG TPA: polysaccharide pyruvyl transferase CsaB [Trueperaceae bacterium]|nr:polysaccharide pyruvyl transferase CsaB [Trueperaceae bacterium]
MKVVISGYYGFGNLGDEALLSGLTQGLVSRGHEPVVLSGDPAATTALHGVGSRHRTRGLTGAILGADALVSGGGGLLQDGTSSRSLRYYLGVIRLARLLGRPAIVYGQSLGPLSDSGRARVAAALRGVPLLLRDEPSRVLAASLGAHARLVADPALLLPAPSALPSLEPRPVVLVPRGGQQTLNGSLERLAARLVAAGRTVKVVSFHPAEDDQSVARLVAAVPAVSSVPVRTPIEALEAFVRASYVVSVRLHGCILAAVAGVGFAGLSYDRKVAGFLVQAGAPSFEPPADDEDLARLALAGPVQDQAATTRLVDLADSGIDQLVAELEPRGGGGGRGRTRTASTR